LGVYFDPSMTWGGHLNHVSSSVNKKVGLIYRTRPFLNEEILKTIYQSLILPNMDYCDIVWGNVCKKFTTKLDKLQNRAGKAILKVNKRFPTSLMLKCLDWDDLHTRRNIHLNVMVYNCVTGKVPGYLCNTFDKLSDITSYSSRGSLQGNIRPPKFKNNAGKRTFKYRGAVSWNQLNSSIKIPLPRTKKLFKQALKVNPS